MDDGPPLGDRAGPGGIAEADGGREIPDAVNAVRLRADWRPLVGLTGADEGTLVELVLARVVTERAVDAHNRDVKQAEKRG